MKSHQSKLGTLSDVELIMTAMDCALRDLSMETAVVLVMLGKVLRFALKEMILQTWYLLALPTKH